MSAVITSSGFAFLFDKALAVAGAFALDKLPMGLASSEAARLSKGLFGMREAHGPMVQQGEKRARGARAPKKVVGGIWLFTHPT